MCNPLRKEEISSDKIKQILEERIQQRVQSMEGLVLAKEVNPGIKEEMSLEEIIKNTRETFQRLEELSVTKSETPKKGLSPEKSQSNRGLVLTTQLNTIESDTSEKSRQTKSVERWDKLISAKLGTPEQVINQMIDFVKYPVINEKTYKGLITKRQFTFDIDKRLTKPQIKGLFENLFKVNVMSVNTLIPPRKKLRVGIAQGFRPLYKRAIITLKEDQSLNFLNMNPIGLPAAQTTEKDSGNQSLNTSES